MALLSYPYRPAVAPATRRHPVVAFRLRLRRYQAITSWFVVKCVLLACVFTLFWLGPLLKICGVLTCNWWLASGVLLLVWVPAALLVLGLGTCRLVRAFFRWLHKNGPLTLSGIDQEWIDSQW